ncbi:hypothetical protein NPIL_45751 [Nephila pilipes]|uniref:Uncharacterized protein n=1 Tax=Nephila pilipes TaxID=299642 RepID=A0A8X6R0Q3_NEPPI|nr:hypothetical protein NPIL_45751 [Nephila pilipes]
MSGCDSGTFLRRLFISHIGAVIVNWLKMRGSSGFSSGVQSALASSIVGLDYFCVYEVTDVRYLHAEYLVARISLGTGGVRDTEDVRASMRRRYQAFITARGWPFEQLYESC